jgi:type I restriction enzyme S subunit
LPTPPQHLLEQFDAVGAGFSDHAEHLADAAEMLMSIRDLLLPKLVSGAIDVRSLDLDLELERASA